MNLSASLVSWVLPSPATPAEPPKPKRFVILLYQLDSLNTKFLLYYDRIGCVACAETFLETLMVRTPCSHHYCTECVVNLFTSSMTDETLMPPRCCRQEIPLRSVAAHLGGRVVRDFEAKKWEFSTADRLYCPIEWCSAFIGPAATTHGTSVNCPRCYQAICAYCKIPQHSRRVPCGRDKDAASKLLLELGEREGWRRCGNCRRLVELKDGW